MKNYGSIPEPQANIASLLDTVRSMKQIIEATIGQRDVAPTPAHTVDKYAPLNPRVGDLWTRPSEPFSDVRTATYITWRALGCVVSVWTGTEWMPISVAGEWLEQYRSTGVNLNNTASFFSVNVSPLFGGPNQIWFIEFEAVVQDSAGAGAFFIRIVDENSTNLQGGTNTSSAAARNITIRTSAVVRLTRPTIITGQLQDATSVNGLAVGGNNNKIRAIRLL